MGWIRVSDDFYDNDKFGEVGPLGVALHLAALGFCNRKLSDGFFKKNKARLLLDFDGISITTATAELCAFGVDGDEAAKLVIGWMVAADLWHEYGHDCDACHSRADGGEPAANEYLIHDYLNFQPSRAEVEAKAAATKKRVDAWRQAQKVGNSVGNSVTNDVRTDAVTPDVHHNPTPTPTPSSSLVTYGGRVTKVDVREGEPPSKCPKHLEHPDPPNCNPCKNARLANEAWHVAQRDDELAQRRQRKELSEGCLICHGTNWIPDTEPAVKCGHQESAHA